MENNELKELKQGDIPAFPMCAVYPTGKTDFKTGHPEMQVLVQQGMTLRDQVAIAAIAVFKDSFSLAESLQKDFAPVCEACYRLADAMIKSR